MRCVRGGVCVLRARQQQLHTERPAESVLAQLHRYTVRKDERERERERERETDPTVPCAQVMPDLIRQ